MFCWCDRSISRIVVGMKHLSFSCFSASTRKRKKFDPFAYACTYASIKASVKLDLHVCACSCVASENQVNASIVYFIVLHIFLFLFSSNGNI